MAEATDEGFRSAEGVGVRGPQVPYSPGAASTSACGGSSTVHSRRLVAGATSRQVQCRSGGLGTSPTAGPPTSTKTQCDWTGSPNSWLLGKQKSQYRRLDIDGGYEEPPPTKLDAARRPKAIRLDFYIDNAADVADADGDH